MTIGTTGTRPGTGATANDEGFTLVELMVVVLIISILIGIAVPTFLGARVRAQDAAATSRLDTVLKAAETLYIDDEHFMAITPGRGINIARSWSRSNAGAALLEEVEPAIDFTTDSRVPNGSVSYWVHSAVPGHNPATKAQILALWTQSESGTFFCAVLVKKDMDRWGTQLPPGIYRGQATRYRDVDDARDCIQRRDTGW